MRNIILVVVAVLALIIAGLGAYLTPDDLRKCRNVTPGTDDCVVADAIVAISGGNTSVRAAEAIRLYQDGWAHTLVFSGAAKDTSGPSNAEVMRRQALKAGVPEEDIKIENLAQTTRENAEKTKRLLVDRGSGSANRIILVTSAYHQRRASLEFSALAGDGIAVVNHPASGDPDWPWYWWATPRGWWLAIGETAKIIAFYLGHSQ